MSYESMVGNVQAWKHDGDGAYTQADVVVGLSVDDDSGTVELNFTVGGKREQVYLRVDSEALMLALFRVNTGRKEAA